MITDSLKKRHVPEVLEGLDELGFVSRVAAWEEGEATVVVDEGPEQKVVWLDNQAHIKKTLDKFPVKNPVRGIIPQKNMGFIYILRVDGLVKRCYLQGRIPPYQAKVESVGELSHGDIYNNDVLLLSDYTNGEIFTFDLDRYDSQKDQHDKIGVKVTKVAGLIQPTTVSVCGSTADRQFIVCEYGRHKLNIYIEDKKSSAWCIQRQLGRSEGQPLSDIAIRHQIDPRWVVVLENGNILICDSANHNVFEYTTRGSFVKVWLSHADVEWPTCIAAEGNHLWVVCAKWDEPYRVKSFTCPTS